MSIPLSSHGNVFVHKGGKLEKRKFLAKMHQIASNYVSNFKIFPGWHPRTPSLGRGTHPTQTPLRSALRASTRGLRPLDGPPDSSVLPSETNGWIKPCFHRHSTCTVAAGSAWCCGSVCQNIRCYVGGFSSSFCFVFFLLLWHILFLFQNVLVRWTRDEFGCLWLTFAVISSRTSIGIVLMSWTVILAEDVTGDRRSSRLSLVDLRLARTKTGSNICWSVSLKCFHYSF